MGGGAFPVRRSVLAMASQAGLSIGHQYLAVDLQDGGRVGVSHPCAPACFRACMQVSHSRNANVMWQLKSAGLFGRGQTLALEVVRCV